MANSEIINKIDKQIDFWATELREINERFIRDEAYRKGIIDGLAYARSCINAEERKKEEKNADSDH